MLITRSYPGHFTCIYIKAALTPFQAVKVSDIEHRHLSAALTHFQLKQYSPLIPVVNYVHAYFGRVYSLVR